MTVWLTYWRIFLHQRPFLTSCCSLRTTPSFLKRERGVTFSIHEKFINLPSKMLVSYFADPLQFVDAPLVWMIWIVPRNGKPTVFYFSVVSISLYCIVCRVVNYSDYWNQMHIINIRLDQHHNHTIWIDFFQFYLCSQSNIVLADKCNLIT